MIWRENPSCYLQDGEHAVLMAALMTDNQGRPLIHAWIKRSGLTADAWLEKLFEATAIATTTALSTGWRSSPTARTSRW